MSGFLAFGRARTTSRHEEGVVAPSSVWAPMRRGVFLALWCGAAALVAGFATYRWRLEEATEVQTDPVTRPHLTVAMPIDPESDPALITVEYWISLGKAGEFVGAMAQMRRIRLRDGAVFWGLFVDVNRPDRFVEHFVTETWVEHLRQHERMIASDVVYESHARSFHLGDAPAATHLISDNAVALHNPGSFKRDGATNGAVDSEPVLKRVLP